MAAKVDPEKCDACGSCVDACPVQAIELKGKAVINAEECILIAEHALTNVQMKP